MPDRKPTLAGRIGAELSMVRWPAPEEIRARARRRSRVQMLTGSVAVVVAIAAGSVVALVGGPYGGRPVPGGSPTPAALPARIDIPEAALLRPEDVGPGLVVDRVNVSEGGYAEPLDRIVPHLCPAYQRLDPYEGPVVAVRRHTVQRPPKVPGEPGSGDAVVHERVTRLSPDAARRVFADARAVPEVCARYTSSGPLQVAGRTMLAEAEHHWTVLAEGFTGDESVLLELRIVIRRDRNTEVLPPPSVSRIGVVRVGDLVAVLNWAPRAPQPERGREVTSAAAARLCSAANPGC